MKAAPVSLSKIEAAGGRNLFPGMSIQSQREYLPRFLPCRDYHVYNTPRPAMSQIQHLDICRHQRITFNDRFLLSLGYNLHANPQITNQFMNGNGPPIGWYPKPPVPGSRSVLGVWCSLLYSLWNNCPTPTCAYACTFRQYAPE